MKKLSSSIIHPYKRIFTEEHDCDCSTCPKYEGCAKRKKKEMEQYGFEEEEDYEDRMKGHVSEGDLWEDSLCEMSPEFCKQKTQKAGDGTVYTFKNGSCEITKCPTGSILDRGSGRCHKMAKEARIKEAGEKWSGKVKTKWEPKEGLFSSGSAEEIANSASRGHGGDKGAAIKALSFYKNRAGKNLSADRKSTIDAAIKKLQKENE